MHAYLIVGIGGAMGSMARYGIGRVLPSGSFPYATLTVNLVGALLMGLLMAVLSRVSLEWGEEARLLIGVGLLGGFTTFSAFSLDVVTLLQRGEWVSFFTYISLSVLGSIAALAFGFWLARGVF